MKNKAYLVLSLAVSGFFVAALLLFAFQGGTFSGISQTAAISNVVSKQVYKGAKYPVTAEIPQVKSKAAPATSNNGQISPSSSFGTTATVSYIVELTTPSISVKYKELKDQAPSKALSSASKATLVSQKSKITNEQDSFFNSLPSSAKARNSAKAVSTKSKRFNTVINAVVIDATDAEIASIKKLSNVKSVEPVTTVRAFLMDSVPLIHAPQVWAGAVASTSLTGRGISIAIIDTGVDYTHPDLGGCLGTKGTSTCKVAGGWDFVNGDADPMDDMGHGTHVAAIAAGNGVLKGVAPDATLYAYKVLNAAGSGYTNEIVAAIERVTDPNSDGDLSDRMDIASMSLGGYGNPDDDMSTAVNNAVAAGVVFTIAAGNQGPSSGTIGSPGTARNAITVAASDKSDNLAYFSSRGPVQWVAADGSTKFLVKPDVTAPGVAICAARWGTAFPTGDANCNNDSNHVAISGTSMATPHVAGEAALLLQLHRDWTPAEVKAAIRNNAVLPTITCPPGYTCTPSIARADWGYGRIDALKLAKSAKPPVAQINPLGIIKGNVNISGTALASNFSQYKLSYGAGENPTSFTDLVTSSQPVNNRVLFSNFDSTTLGDGRYTLRLIVTDTSGATSTDEALLEVKNITITSPLSNDIYKPGKIIPIIGTIAGSPTRFAVEYQAEGNLGWETAGITLSNGGIGGINNATIATWNTSSITSSGFYNLRVSANFNGVTGSQTLYGIYFDTSLHDGWPVHIDYDVVNSSMALSPTTKYIVTASPEKRGQIKVMSPSELKQEESRAQITQTYYGVSFIEPIADDLDNDGKKEIIIAKGGVLPKIQVYSENGTLLWSKTFGNVAITYNYILPVVGDIDGNGKDDIVVLSIGDFTQPTSDLYAFSGTGEQLWHTSVPKNYYPGMVLADLDHRGSKEIVLQGNGANGEVIIKAATGVITKQWNIPESHWSGSLQATPSVGNFDDDDDLEIVSITPTEKAGYDIPTQKLINEAALYVYNIDGSVVQGFPVILPGSLSSSPVTGDIDGDGKDDIVVGLIYSSDIFPEPSLGGLYAIDRTGAIMPGWPVFKGYNFWSTPSLADVNGDGKLEIGAGRLGFSSYLLNYRGETLSGWPEPTCWNDYYSSIMADVNNDKKTDLLTTTGSGVGYGCRGTGGVSGWNQNGSKVTSFPKATESDAQAFASVSDLKGNGNLNLLASSNFDSDNSTGNYKMRGSVYVWDLDSTFASSSLPWPTFKHDNQRTGMYSYVGTGSTTPDVDPTVGVFKNSTLAMTYNPDGAESELVTLFKVQINAGSMSQKIDKNGAFEFDLRTDSGLSGGGAETYDRPASTTDDGHGFYTIPANGSAIFTINLRTNPKTMFAGTYYAFLNRVRLGGYDDAKYIDLGSLYRTNPLTIIGEVSPYINSINPKPVPTNKLMTIEGVRFAPTGNIVNFYTKPDTNSKSKTVNSTDGGKTLQFVPGIPEGDYYVQVTSPVTGTSNGMNVMVGPVAKPVIDSISPTSGMPGTMVTVSGSNFGATNIVQFNGNILDVPSDGSTLRFTVPSDTSVDTYGLSVIDSADKETGHNSNTVQFTVEARPPQVNQPPFITNVVAPTTLFVNQPGTWTITGIDPQMGKLGYTIEWGSLPCPAGTRCPPLEVTEVPPGPPTAPLTGNDIGRAAPQTITVNHTYAYAGTYTVKIKITNPAGLTADTSANVSVVIGTKTPTVPTSTKQTSSVWDAIKSAIGL